MNAGSARKDLLVLVADADMEEAMKGVLSRQEALGIRRVSFDIRRHPNHDPGCRTQGVEFLRPFAKQYHHALVLFDHEGSGAEGVPAHELEAQIEEQLGKVGWEDRARSIVISPELETWVWSGSRHVGELLGWGNSPTPLGAWLREENWTEGGSSKPQRPKEAFGAALREVRKARSSAIFRAIAEKVGLTACEDRAFLRLKDTLRLWFEEGKGTG